MTDAMNANTEAELARVLLVELLAYQLASPVQWTDTQDVLLRRQETKRLIEIGPANTLVAMAKKMLANQPEDAEKLIKRELLCYMKDSKDIRCEVDPPAKPETEAAPEPPKPVEPQPAAPVEPVIAPGPPLAVAVNIPDAVPTAKEIVVAIIASKLQQAFDTLPLDKTIKQLAGGRSMIENEIVGDLGAELGSLPDRLEDTRLDSLCEQLQQSHPPSGSLKKPTLGLITRLFSQKMPSGFSASKARAYMQDSWGLGPGRQNSIIIRAAASQPAARLGSEAEGRAFFDGFIHEYGKEHKLNLLAPNSGSPSGNSAATSSAKASSMPDPDKEARRMRKIALLTKLYGIDPTGGNQATRQAQEEVEALQGKLDGLHSELGEAFASGIQPMFSAAKVRKFDSSWNWGMQDLMNTYYSLLTNPEQESDTTELGNALSNRVDNRILRVAQYLLEKQHQPTVAGTKAAKDLLQAMLKRSDGSEREPKIDFHSDWTLAPRVEVMENGLIDYREVPRNEEVPTPSIYMESWEESGWQKDNKLTDVFFKASQKAQESGLSFRGKNVLITGAGPRSIGAEVVQNLMKGGASVVVTTSSYSPATVRWYQEMYTTYGAPGAELIVVPFNQGSQMDIEGLVEYIYDTKNGLGWDLDHVVPLAAISERGREVDGIDSKSELAHRVMLTNLVRLLGAVKKHKQAGGHSCRPTQVVLPLSPNHGVFGGDGLYAESKISLETLANKWSSESWAEYLCICGARIGWTRGTGLMAANDTLAMGVEKIGVRTFSCQEMAFYLLLLMSRSVAKENELEPMFADLTGGMSEVKDLKASMTAITKEINDKVSTRKALLEEKRLEAAALEDPEDVLQQANLQLDYPKLGSHASEVAAAGVDLAGMVDLDSVVVITGFSEVGPWGNARTRWEMEATGRFSMEGCVEMAWIMGLIKHKDGHVNGKHYVGWIDAKSGEPVRDSDVKAQYEAEILQHTGIRLIEPEMDDGYDPTQKQFLQEIILEDDLPPFQVAKSVAADFLTEHGENADVVDVPGSDGEECSVYLKKGATLYIPKAIQVDRRIAGQIPAGWDAKRYGVTDDIVAQVDRVTLFALISTAEALIHSGLTDPYELYKYLHVSEVGNCIGSGLGGQKALKGMYKSRYMEKQVQTDVLQETFINTIPAWVNMLLMSAAGPIRTPVGACATSLESLETGYETIVTGKAKMCLVGGFDDITEHPTAEFANMNVTTNDLDEEAKGRTPQESSRPTASSRGGFVESQGGGVQVITSARLALDMGLPIRGIVAWVSTASDGQSRSVPAAGKGILVNAREEKAKFPSSLLDLDNRRRRLHRRKQHIQASLEAEIEMIRTDSEDDGYQSTEVQEELAARIADARKLAGRQEKGALNTLGNNFWHANPEIAPIRGALAVWGLTIDDLDFASFHGTSTKNNDLNETSVIQTQLQHLGRNTGNPIFGIFQKYLTGHSKGGAAAWMLNGCLQTLESGTIPGNRNADNIDAKLRDRELLVFPNRSIQTPSLKAFSISSFGFGQKGAQAIGVHPRYLFASVSEEEYSAYAQRWQTRRLKAESHFERSMILGTIFVPKSSAPYEKSREAEVLLHPKMRF